MTSDGTESPGQTVDRDQALWFSRLELLGVKSGWKWAIQLDRRVAKSKSYLDWYFPSCSIDEKPVAGLPKPGMYQTLYLYRWYVFYIVSPFFWFGSYQLVELGCSLTATSFSYWMVLVWDNLQEINLWSLIPTHVAVNNSNVQSSSLYRLSGSRDFWFDMLVMLRI